MHRGKTTTILWLEIGFFFGSVLDLVINFIDFNMNDRLGSDQSAHKDPEDFKNAQTL